MEPQTQVLLTSRGELTISGPIKSLPDLSFADLNQPALVKSEEGQKINTFAKPSQDLIQHEFNVKFTKLLNDLFKQEKYSELFASDIQDTIQLNRYKDLLVYLRNSVTLPEFINASWVAGPFSPSQDTQYIATQGPLPATVESFWKMVWVYQVQSIFMLCSIHECEINKCEFYWPYRQSFIQIAGFVITLLEEIKKVGHFIRILEIRLGTETKIVKHYHYISWPDLGVPQEFQTLESLVEDLHSAEGARPIIIHCSAGVGRTGTFIALSHLKHVISAQKAAGADYGVSVFSIVRRLREQRIMMVETKEQYELLYDFAELWSMS